MVAKIKDKSGYTIIEVIVAMVILIIGVLALLPMIALNVKSNVASRTFGIANYLAQEKLEKVKSWPLYEDVSGTGPYGLTTNNTELFAYETNLTVNNWKVYFNRTTEVYHNGHDQGGNGVIFGTNIDDGLMNTGAVDQDGGGNYVGEDFKMIKVKVDWNDNFGYHEITRHMFISKF